MDRFWKIVHHVGSCIMCGGTVWRLRPNRVADRVPGRERSWLDERPVQLSVRPSTNYNKADTVGHVSYLSLNAADFKMCPSQYLSKIVMLSAAPSLPQRKTWRGKELSRYCGGTWGQGAYRLGGELCDEHLKELNSIQGYVVNKEIESSSSMVISASP
jgi:hypothetical protein